MSTNEQLDKTQREWGKDGEGRVLMTERQRARMDVARKANEAQIRLVAYDRAYALANGMGQPMALGNTGLVAMPPASDTPPRPRSMAELVNDADVLFQFLWAGKVPELPAGFTGNVVALGPITKQ